jgi:hypothetical protein
VIRVVVGAIMMEIYGVHFYVEMMMRECRNYSSVWLALLDFGDDGRLPEFHAIGRTYFPNLTKVCALPNLKMYCSVSVHTYTCTYLTKV